MRTINSDFPEIKIIYLDQYMDERGMFAETYDRRTFSALGIDIDFVQDSCSFSIARGTVRGLHFQIPPFAQHKLVRVTHGRIFDVVVDLRSGSSTFGQHVSFELDASSWRHIFVPIGFAHGFCTLEDNTQIVYKMSDHYSPDHYGGIMWNDPDLGIDWPVSGDEVIISEKDKQNLHLKDSSINF